MARLFAVLFLCTAASAEITSVTPGSAKARGCEGGTKVAAAHWTARYASVGAGGAMDRSGAGVSAAAAAAHKKANRDELAALAKQAKDGGAKLFVTPELAVVGYPQHRNFLSAREAMPYAEEVPPAESIPVPATHPTTAFFAKLASEYKMYLHVGLLERVGEKLYNTVVALGPDGKVVARHRKVHRYGDPKARVGADDPKAGEFNYIEPGNAESTSYVSPELGKVGLAICADIYDHMDHPKHPEKSVMAHHRRAGLDVLTISSAWELPFDTDPGETKGWTPGRFFEEAAKYARATTVVSNNNAPAPTAGVWYRSGRAQAVSTRGGATRTQTSEVVFGCVLRPYEEVRLPTRTNLSHF